MVEEIARTLNEDRRQLTPEQRRPVVKALREEGHSIRAIAGALGVNRGSIEHDLKQARVVTTTPGPEATVHQWTVEGERARNRPRRQELPGELGEHTF